MVYATIPSSVYGGSGDVRSIGFLAHVDTSPAVTGAT